MSIFRPGSLYVFIVHHPTTGKPVCGYVGKTRRRWMTRIHEHLKGSTTASPKDWADTVIRYKRIYYSPRVSGFGLSMREYWHICRRRPLYNIQGNMANPRRIPPWVAKEQRYSRNVGKTTRRYAARSAANTVVDRGIRVRNGKVTRYGRLERSA